METMSSNASLAAALRQMAESGRIPHAMLFHQNDGGGAFPLILDFLDEVYGHNPRVKKLIHPDIHFVFPVAGADKPVSDRFIGAWRELLQENPCFFENELYTAIGIEGKQGLISVNEARSILDKLSLSAVEGGYRTVVVYLPEKMNPQAANALLKMVEEPPEKTLFLLVTLQPEKVLTTIFSRCLFMRVRPFSREEDRVVHAKEGAETTEELPLNFQWGPQLGSFRPFVFGEPFIGYQISSTDRGNEHIRDWAKQAKNKLEFGFGLGAGLEISSHLQLSVQWFKNLGVMFSKPAEAGAEPLEHIQNFEGIKFSLAILL